MAETLDQKPGTSTQIKQDVEQLQTVQFGAGVATAAAEAAKADAVVEKESPKVRTKHDHDHTQTLVEAREAETNEIILASGGSITGGQQKQNSQLTKKTLDGELDTPWDEVNKTDDLETALQKKAQLAALSANTQTEEVETPEQRLSLKEMEGLNDVSLIVRQHGHFSVLQQDPELIIIMGGLSETFDTFAAARGVSVSNPAELSDSDLQFVLQMLQQSKKKTLSEDEKEAELILSGAVAILAIPEILKKLEELGIDPEDVPSLRGQLAQLIEEAEKIDSPFHNMFLLIREEAEYSKLPPEDENAQTL